MARKLGPFLALLVCLASCSRGSRQAIPQIAILRFENLSADASLDWMGRAFSEVLSVELQGSPQRYAIQYRALHAFDNSLGVRPAAPGISAESAGAFLAGANTAVYGDFSVVGDVLRATATEEDLTTHKVLRLFTASGPARDGVLPVAEALARQLGETHPFGAVTESALRAYVDALEAPDPATSTRSFTLAVAGSPTFGRAYVLWLDNAIARQDRGAAEHILAEARAHQDGISALDRASIDLGAAALAGDYPARIAALRKLSQLDPANPDQHRALGEALMQMRQFEEAIVEFRRGLSVRPNDALALNIMGYAAAYSGDLPTAVRVLRGYEQLRPNDPNPLDSLGDVHFALGHFAEAEKFYLAARAKSPAFLNGGDGLKAAQARLMTGDVAGATELFNRYLAARRAAKDPNAPYHEAAWSWQTGARRAAIAAIDRLAREAAAGPFRDLACRADAQATIWLLNLGDRAAAAAHARKAVDEASPVNAPVAVLVAHLALPDSFPAPSQSPLREYARAYTLLYAKQFAPAAQVLEEIYRLPTADLDDGLAVLLAWAYQETGQWQRAAPLLRLTPLPDAGGLPMLSSLYFPRLFFLRAAILGRDGHRAEAARNYQFFRSLSGPDTTIWGEEQRMPQ